MERDLLGFVWLDGNIAGEQVLHVVCVLCAFAALRETMRFHAKTPGRKGGIENVE